MCAKSDLTRSQKLANQNQSDLMHVI